MERATVLPITSLNASYTPALSAVQDGTTDESSTEAKSPVPQGIHVQLSELGINKSAASKDNRSIDESDLPGQIRTLLNMIRELRSQLAEKIAELQTIMSNLSLDAEARQIMAQGLHTQIASLNGAISSAMGSLIKAMKNSDMSPEQLMQTAALLVQ